MRLTPGVRLGPYEILALLGSGGMGEVYRARDTRLDRHVAVKVLPAAHVADPAFRQRFEREARTIAALNDPHICTVHDVGREGGIDYLVMELIEGLTLGARLEASRLPLKEAIAYGRQIASALERAHRGAVSRAGGRPRRRAPHPRGCRAEGNRARLADSRLGWPHDHFFDLSRSGSGNRRDDHRRRSPGGRSCIPQMASRCGCPRLAAGIRSGAGMGAKSSTARRTTG